MPQGKTLPLTALVVDDEKLAREGLALRLEALGSVDILEQCENGRAALRAITAYEPDVVFLDIQMPGISGFDLISQIQGDAMPMLVFVTAFDAFAIDAFQFHAVDYLLKPVEQDRLQAAVDRCRERKAGRTASADNQGDAMPMLVFVTAFDAFAIDAFQFHAVDYLLKPVEQDRLQAAVDRCRERKAGRTASADKHRLLEMVVSLSGKSEDAIRDVLLTDHMQEHRIDRLAIKDGSSTSFVSIRDIDWIDAAGDYMCVHVGTQTHIMRTTMKELESKLDASVFQRVHRSTIVNLERVEKVSSHMNGEYYLTLIGGSTLKMSRSYKNKIKHFFPES